MKHLIAALAAVFTVALAQASYAQTIGAAAGSNSTAINSNRSQSASVAGASNNLIFNTPTSTTSKAELKNVPSVTAPSLGGGGHPCLQASSGGFSVMGGGISGGASRLDPICMLSFLGQNEAAIRALVSNHPIACEALANVGYYVVPMGNGKTKAVAFNCGKNLVKGGVRSAEAQPIGYKAAATSTQSSTRPVARPTNGYSKCAVDADGAVRIKYKHGANKQLAKSACLTSLGY